MRLLGLRVSLLAAFVFTPSIFCRDVARQVAVPILGNLQFVDELEKIEAFREKGVDAGEMTLQVAQDVKLHGISILKPLLRVSPLGFADKKLGPGYEIVGEATVYGRQIEAHLYLTLPQLAPLSAPEDNPGVKRPTLDFTLYFEGMFKSKEPFRPFASIQLPVLQKIAIRDPKVILEATVKLGGADAATSQEGVAKKEAPKEAPRAAYRVAVQGEVDILGVSLIGTASLLVARDGRKGMVLRGTAPQTWNVPNPWGGLEVTDGTLIASSMEFTDRILRLKVRRGVGIYGKLSLTSKHFTNIHKLLDRHIDNIRVYVNVGLHMSDHVIMGALPVDLKFPQRKGAKHLRGADVFLELTGKPSLFLITTLYVQPTSKDQELAFSARIGLKLSGFAVAGTMAGVWKHPFGIKGLVLSDLAIQGAGSYVLGMPGEFGIIGTLKVGEKQVKMGVNVALDVRDVAAIGKIDSLGFDDMAALARRMGAKRLSTLYPSINLKDVDIRLAPLGSRIGEIAIEPGLTAKGFLEIGDKRGGIDVNVDLFGVRWKGFLPTLTFPVFSPIPILTLTGTGPDGKMGTGDDGPILDMALTLKEQHYFLSAEAKLLGMSRAVRVNVDKNRVYFSLVGKIFNLFQTSLLVEGKGGLKKPDFYVSGMLQNDFKTVIEQKVENLLKNRKGHKAFAFTFKVTKAAIEGRLSDIAAGKTPTLLLEYWYRGKKQNIAISYDFVRPIRNLVTLVDHLVLKPGVEKIKAKGRDVAAKIETIASTVQSRARGAVIELRRRRAQ